MHLHQDISGQLTMMLCHLPPQGSLGRCPRSFGIPLVHRSLSLVVVACRWLSYSQLKAQYSQQLVPMFDEERTKAKTWLNSQSWAPWL